jgi:hypothetical protein
MYSEKFVVAVKHNGRVLREQGDTVLIPFGSEFSLFFKNLNSVRALARVQVDGQDATKGTSLIIPPKGTVELERFLDASQMDKGHKFKFIERTSKIENGPRGIQAEDGLIRIEFEFEKQPPKYETIKRTYVDEYWSRPYYWNGPIWSSSATVSSSDCAFGNSTTTLSAKSASPFRSLGANAASFSATSGEVTAQNAAFVNDVGITVPGSLSEQKFEVGAWFPTDGQTHVMVLKLLGQVGKQKVERPVTVKTMQECPTCGTKNKHGTKFCRECGTGLSLL